LKATQRDFAAIAPKAVQAARIFFFCGPDESGARDAAERICALLPDAGERIELSGAELRRDPPRLADEAHSTSLFGANRHIWLRAQGDEAHDALANLIDSDVEPCPVLVVATGATDKSRSAKLLADRSDALVAMFHPPDLRQVASAVRRMAGAAGLKLDDDIAERLARAANLDTRVAQSEIDKLATYLDVSRERPGQASGAALDAIGARTEEEGFAPLVNAVLGGSATLLAAELRRCRELRLNPVAVLLALERRAAQLATLAARLGPRGDIAALLKSESAARRIFWKDQADIAGQLRRWRGKALERLQSRLVALHQRLLADSQAAEVLLDQELSEITRMAARLG
jgi:DNA polymerase-3 subunit delta